MEGKIEVKENGSVILFFNQWSQEELEVTRDAITKALDDRSRKYHWLHRVSIGDPLVYTQTWTPVKE